MKTKRTRVIKNTEEIKKAIFHYYDEKYFNLFLNESKWLRISLEQREYLLRRFWNEGKVLAFNIISPEKTFIGGQAPKEVESGLLGFSKFTESTYNMFNFPTTLLATNERGVPYIPAGPLTNNVDCVIGYALHTRQPIRSLIEVKIEQIVSIEMTIRTNLALQKMPFLVEVTPESKLSAQEMINAILNDEVSVFADVNRAGSLGAANTGTSYIIDKLYDYKCSIENEICTILGLDNISVEKKERLITDEANANNDIINASADIFFDNFNEFCENIKRVLNYDISVERRRKDEVNSVHEEQSEGQPDEN